MMCHGDDAKFLGRNLIDDAMGKPAKEISAPISTEDGAEVGIRQQGINRPLELGHKRKSKFDVCALGIESSRIVQFRERRRNDDQLHFNAARTCARASAIGIT